MPNPKKINVLKDIVEKIKSIDIDLILRPSLGKVSTESELSTVFEEVFSKMDTALEIAHKVSNTDIDHVIGTLNEIHSNMNSQVDKTDQDYVASKDQFVNSINSYADQLRQWWPPFVAAQVEEKGFLQDEDIRKERKRLISEIADESQKAIEQVKEESLKVIEEAREEAKKIKGAARRTATKVSVTEAQSQFEEAKIHHRNQSFLWSGISVVSIAAFIAFAILFYLAKLPKEWGWQVIYYTAIRITILTAIGAVATFTLRILRAHLHMYQHNAHRKRIANSMAAFVESALTDQQRDLILAHLVDAVADFGTSGLLQKEDDNIYSPKMTIDNITRTVTSPGP